MQKVYKPTSGFQTWKIMHWPSLARLIRHTENGFEKGNVTGTIQSVIIHSDTKFMN